jgi:hypothetical protein
MVMGGHGDFMDALVGMNNGEVGIEGGELGQPCFFKRNSDGEIGLGFGYGSHLAGFGFVIMRVLAGRNHDADIDSILSDFFNKIFLGRDADEDHVFFRTNGSGQGEYEGYSEYY